jgi:hypothetical protein
MLQSVSKNAASYPRVTFRVSVLAFLLLGIGIRSKGTFAVFFGPEKFVRRARQMSDGAYDELLRLRALLEQVLEGATWERQRI